MGWLPAVLYRAPLIQQCCRQASYSGLGVHLAFWTGRAPSQHKWLLAGVTSPCCLEYAATCSTRKTARVPADARYSGAAGWQQRHRHQACRLQRRRRQPAEQRGLPRQAAGQGAKSNHQSLTRIATAIADKLHDVNHSLCRTTATTCKPGLAVTVHILYWASCNLAATAVEKFACCL